VDGLFYKLGVNWLFRGETVRAGENQLELLLLNPLLHELDCMTLLLKLWFNEVWD
jgi:hypothetical protein